MAEINFSEIEKKWQKKWEESKIFEVSEKSKKEKFYILEMFPYPSGSGLHMGHAWNYTIGDIFARYKIMNGFNVLHPMGYDALGLPAENAAIIAGEHPQDYTDKSIKNYIKQQKNLGLSYDWSRMISSADPSFYHWDQFLFLKMFKRGLAYRKEAAVNWCPKCQSVLANEQVIDGKCWRHEDTDVEIKQLKQWFFKTTHYADELYESIDKLDWPERTKAMQKNWIGKSHGTEIDFEINGKSWPIFTTRPDTIYGVTFMVISAQHPKLMELVTKEQKNEVEKFLKKIKGVSQKNMKDVEELNKEGVFTGSFAINPVNGEKVPVWAGNFVVADYGSGMVMAVPAHDQRDFEFAKKYGIGIKQVICSKDPLDFNKRFTGQKAFVEDGILMSSKQFSAMPNDKAKKEITKWLEEKNKARHVVNFRLRDWLISRQRYWGTPIPIVYCEKCKKEIEENSSEIHFYNNEAFEQLSSGLKTVETRALNPEEKNRYFGNLKAGNSLKCVNKNNDEITYLEILEVNKYKNLKELWENKKIHKEIFPNKTFSLFSDFEKVYSYNNDYLDKIKKNGLILWKVKKVVPGAVPLSEKDLPLVLPHDVKFGKGNPLETNKDWVNTTCPKCRGKARRETDTMDTFVNSSWYYLRYCDPHNDKKIFDKQKVKYWCPIDVYIGGAEHACLHLIFVRFYAKFLSDLGLINFREPAKKLFHQGMLRAEGGEKMSKSKGTVVAPETVSSAYGIDTARYFLCSLASPDKDIDWSEQGISGSLRFIKKIYSVFENVKIGKDSPEVLSKLNKTIKNVTSEIENFEYRKASIELKELFEFFSVQEEISKDTLGKSIKLLSPFCPHVTEELWEKLGNKPFLSTSSWPEADESKIKQKGEIVDLDEKIIAEINYQISKTDKKPKEIFVYLLPFEISKINQKLISDNFDVKIKIFAVNDKDKYDPENRAKRAKPGKPGIYLE